MLQWPPPDVTLGGPEVNKFKQVSSDGYQMSVVGAGLGPEDPRSDVWRAGLGEGGSQV